MAAPKIASGKPAKSAPQTAGKAHQKTKTDETFSAELAKSKTARKEAKKPAKSEPARGARDVDRPKERYLEIADPHAPAWRSVTVTGSVARFNKQGDIVDGGPAHAGRVTKSTTLTVRVTEVTETKQKTLEKRTAEKTYKGDDVVPTTVNLGNRDAYVRAEGEIGTSLTLTAGPHGNVVVDASAAKVTGRDQSTKARHQLSFLRGEGDGSSLTVYKGSPSGDFVDVKSQGKVLVVGGPGDDTILARGGKKSGVDAGGGNDAVGVYGKTSFLAQRTQYRGGAGNDVYGLYDNGAKSQIEDFDPLQDEIRSDAARPRRPE